VSLQPGSRHQVQVVARTARTAAALADHVIVAPARLVHYTIALIIRTTATKAVQAVAVLGKDIWVGLAAPHHFGGNNG